MRQGDDRPGLEWPLLVSAVSVAALMLGFELAKQFFFPKITIWHSHFVTILSISADSFSGGGWLVLETLGFEGEHPNGL